jgi:uncharacterized protein YdcH (DUF465 family)
MSIEKHSIVHEFPEYKDAIHELKMKNTHFAKLFNEYHEVDHEIHGIENNSGNTSDEYLEERKLRRVHLKDEIFGMLKKTS